MNAFEYIEEMKRVVESQKEDAIKNGITDIPVEKFYSTIQGMLDVLNEEMKQAEYNYEIESVNHKIETFGNFTLLEKHLSEDVIIFQPIAIGEEELSAIDMQSMADTLREVHNSGLIKENILLLPPNINIFRAKLAKNEKE